jgi:sugar phosphate permease
MNGKFHYGWMICAGCTLLTTVTMGMITNAGFSIYLPYIAEHGSFSGVEISFIVTVRSIFTLVGMFILPVYYKKLDIRAGTALSAVMAAITFVIYGLAESNYLYYVGVAVAGIAYGLGSMIPVSIIINRWFIEKKALAIGIASCGTGIATLIVPPSVTALVASFGLKITMYLEAIVILAIAGFIFLLLRNDPSSLKCAPYGSGVETVSAHKKDSVKTRDMSALEWTVLSVAMALFGAVAILATTNISLLFTSQGQPSPAVALAISLMGVVLTVSKIIYGKVTDAIGAYRSNYVFSALLLMGLITSCTLGKTGQLGMYASIVLMGLGFPIALVGLSIWAGDLSTKAQLTQAIKRLQIAYQVGGLVFSSVPGFLADRTGSYVPAYLLFCVLLFVSVAVLQCMYRRFMR